MSMAVLRPAPEQADDIVTIGVVLDIPQPHGEFLRQRRAAFGDPLAAEIPPHITLLPPTPVPEDEDQAIQDHLAAVAAVTAPFRIALAGTGSFRPISPVVFVKLAEGAEHCADLQRLLRTGPLKRTLEFDYHPHVTVAHHLDDAAMDRAEAELLGYQAEFEATGLNFYEHDGDGVWQLRRRFGFRAAGG
ncbi:phosphoesterase [Kineosporia sp. NBRC 101677]|nr:phosphoesterase [Kineosporia sp. NBRC 101677]